MEGIVKRGWFGGQGPGRERCLSPPSGAGGGPPFPPTRTGVHEVGETLPKLVGPGHPKGAGREESRAERPGDQRDDPRRGRRLESRSQRSHQDRRSHHGNGEGHGPGAASVPHDLDGGAVPPRRDVHVDGAQLPHRLPLHPPQDLRSLPLVFRGPADLLQDPPHLLREEAGPEAHSRGGTCRDPRRWRRPARLSHPTPWRPKRKRPGSRPRGRSRPRWRWTGSPPGSGPRSRTWRIGCRSRAGSPRLFGG